jgi:hypothetical protein
MDRAAICRGAAVRPNDTEAAKKLNLALTNFSKSHRSLPGILASSARNCLIEQVIESTRRVQYVAAIQERDIDPARADASSVLFDPLKAAIIHRQAGNVEEAFWLTFLFVHFGKGQGCGWRLVRDVYGQLGNSTHWDWPRVSVDPKGFDEWLKENYMTLKSDGVKRTFGNHRKYETLNPSSDNSTGVVVDSYVDWVMTYSSHSQLIQNATNQVGVEPCAIFAYLYKTMTVRRFGRTAKFDYLTMLSKLKLVNMEPPSAYITGSTGPLSGARLLFTGSTSKDLSATEANALVSTLGNELGLGMQVLEDSLCNWQKSPEKFTRFRG